MDKVRGHKMENCSRIKDKTWRITMGVFLEVRANEKAEVKKLRNSQAVKVRICGELMTDLVWRFFND